MIIAIPIDDNRENICVSFGRAPYFLIHNTESGKNDIVDNPAAATEGGAGLKAAQFVVDSGAASLITVRCGQNAAEVFKAANVKIYKALSTYADENLKALAEGKLDELTIFHAGFHGRV